MARFFFYAVMGLMVSLSHSLRAEESVNTKSKKSAYRGIASLAPKKQNLYSEVPNLNLDQNKFKNSNKSKIPFHVYGMCRGANGSIESSNTQGYENNCFNTGTNTSNAQEYFGGSQRQVGLGIKIK